MRPLEHRRPLRRDFTAGILASLLLLLLSWLLIAASFDRRLTTLLHAPDVWLTGVRFGSIAAITVALLGMISLRRGWRAL